MKKTIYAWCRKNLDVTFVLAAAVETPRWVVTFQAVNEPPAVGVPLGILLAFGQARAWDAYFKTKKLSLLLLNLLTLFIAICVVAPVLYGIAAVASHEKVSLLNVLGPKLLTAWVIGLAASTFLPLIQIASANAAEKALEGSHEGSHEGPNQPIKPVTVLPLIDSDVRPSTPLNVTLPVQPALPTRADFQRAATALAEPVVETPEAETPEALIIRVVRETLHALPQGVEDANGLSPTWLLYQTGLTKEVFSAALKTLLTAERPVIRLSDRKIALI